MKEKVTSFPYSWFDSPMYIGSTMTFFAYALWFHSSTGLLLSCVVALAYRVALIFEVGAQLLLAFEERKTFLLALCPMQDSFTARIYSNAKVK